MTSKSKKTLSSVSRVHSIEAWDNPIKLFTAVAYY